MIRFGFQILHKSKKFPRARLGRLTTPHGVIETPAFVTVGTQATVKALSPEQIAACGSQVVLANAYHLMLQPGGKTVAALGGLNAFMGYSGPTMTDSGGFQVFSLGFGLEQGVGKVASIFPAERKKQRRDAAQQKHARLVRITEQGVEFTSHIDGARHMLTPEKSIALQEQLGADMIFAFDECTSPLATKQYTAQALERTHRWLKRCVASRTRQDQAFFGVVQGGAYRDLRQQSARFVAKESSEGFAIGGSLGKSKSDMMRIIDWALAELPEEKPRHLLGIGTPADLAPIMTSGIDLFDCAAATREARMGRLYTNKGSIDIAKAEHAKSKRPIMAGCACYACGHFSRAYLNHLFRANELLGYTLATLHNLTFVNKKVAALRAMIANS